MGCLVATSVIRQKHSSKILAAVLTDMETVKGSLHYANDIVAMLNAGLPIINLELDSNNNVKLTKFDRNCKTRGADITYLQESNKSNNYIVDHFIILISGYKDVYHVFISNDKDELNPLSVVGTIKDIKYTLKKNNIKYNRLNLFNAYYDAKTDKILYEDRECNFKAGVNHKNVRDSLISENCTLIYKPYKLSYNINSIKFNSTNIKLTSEIEGLIKSEGCLYGYYDLTICSENFKLSTYALKDDKQINILTVLNNIAVLPNYLAANSSIKQIECSRTIQKVGMCAFKDCKHLKNINLNVRVIDKGAFHNSGIRTVRLYDCYKIKEIAFAECKNLKHVRAFDCEELEEKAFSGCKNLETVQLPNAKVIGEKAFSGCKSLKEVVLNRNAEIANNAFDKEIKPKINFKFVE